MKDNSPDLVLQHCYSDPTLAKSDQQLFYLEQTPTPSD